MQDWGLYILGAAAYEMALVKYAQQKVLDSEIFAKNV